MPFEPYAALLSGKFVSDWRKRRCVLHTSLVFSALFSTAMESNCSSGNFSTCIERRSNRPAEAYDHAVGGSARFEAVGSKSPDASARRPGAVATRLRETRTTHIQSAVPHCHSARSIFTSSLPTRLAYVSAERYGCSSARSRARATSWRAAS